MWKEENLSPWRLLLLIEAVEVAMGAVAELVKLLPGCMDDDERAWSMETAAEVVEAMAVAEIGSGWSCVPS